MKLDASDQTDAASYDSLLELESEMKCNQLRELRTNRDVRKESPSQYSNLSPEDLMREELKLWRWRFNNMKVRASRAERQVNRLISEANARPPRTKVDKASGPMLGLALRTIHNISRCVNGVGEPHQHPRDLRVLVWETYRQPSPDGDRIMCCHCGHLLNFDDYTIEHLRPKVLGGTDDIDNLRGACRLCNARRPVEDLFHRFNLTTPT